MGDSTERRKGWRAIRVRHVSDSHKLRETGRKTMVWFGVVNSPHSDESLDLCPSLSLVFRYAASKSWKTKSN